MKRVIKAPKNYEKIRTRYVHIKEYECVHCWSRSTEPILCCGIKMPLTHKHTDKDCKGCC
ncbi:MAG TPA: hypothetical protein HA360_02520 [Nanoarchaeota archaeon]|nr:hypothetical protein [Candidatus Woesearchaeota archaeon]HIH15475.1 hypothetical protein [Nanoarchaeota archaeon]HIH59278.1 hypothetical protein [Nanoarchaeota archaeon]HII13927.1 hypothetical protein [Nanoarchaeota archaeon]HIJ04685.1 hypothetical protein [Nanoarchaeota archaeon]